jgi:hypothetical protein
VDDQIPRVPIKLISIEQVVRKLVAQIRPARVGIECLKMKGDVRSKGQSISPIPMGTLVPEIFGWPLVTGTAHSAAHERKRTISTTF